MSQWFSATHWCPRCETTIETLVERAKRFEPIICEECGGLAGPGVGAPRVLTASLPDGVSRGEGYERLKEAAKLKCDAADMPRDKRGDIEREIRKLESTKPDGGQ